MKLIEPSLNQRKLCYDVFHLSSLIFFVKRMKMAQCFAEQSMAMAGRPANQLMNCDFVLFPSFFLFFFLAMNAAEHFRE